MRQVHTYPHRVFLRPARAYALPASAPTVVLTGVIAMLLCYFLAFTQACAAQPPEAAGAPSMIWHSEDMRVYAIQDRPGAMRSSLFSGPASDAERAACFPDGSTPGGVSVFLLDTGSERILFDTGYGDAGSPAKGRLFDLMDSGVLPPESIDYIYLTHMHGDHIGGLLRDGKRVFPASKIVVSKPELDYWTALAQKDPANGSAAKVQEVVAAYEGDVLPPFAFGATLHVNITALDAAGHTPGHTAFRINGVGASLLVIGDLLHAASLQFGYPEECASYDVDRQAAVASRKNILGMAAQEGIPIAGMHIPFPASGDVQVKDAGFVFTPFAGEKAELRK